MDRNEREHIRAISTEIGHWVDGARAILGYRANVAALGNEAVGDLRRRIMVVPREASVGWRVLPLRPEDGRHLAEIAQQAHLPTLLPEEHTALQRLPGDVAAAVHDVRALFGARRVFSGRKTRETADTAARFLARFHEWASAARIPDALNRLARQDDLSELAITDALADWVGLRSRIADLGAVQELFPAAAVADLAAAIANIDIGLGREQRLRADAQVAGEAVRQRHVRDLLVGMPVERLKDATRDRLRIGPLTDAGITTVQAVLDQGAQLELLPGIGGTTATHLRGAAQTLWQTTYDEMPVRIDIKSRTAETTELLRRLLAWDVARSITGATTDLALKDALTPLARALDARVTHIIVIPGDGTIDEFREAVQAVIQRARQVSDGRTGAASADPWDDFLARPADYFAMLAELGFITEDEQKSHGDLPDEIVEAVRRVELNTQYLTASLRGYQSFGARFALAQRKVIIGDEMGLGKTVEALAVLAHLRSRGIHHSLVICPAAVVTNWVREIGTKSKLSAHRLHGPERQVAVRNWIRIGGVAVTTFETLPWLGPHLDKLDGLGCVVVDEAHYIKNPGARRSQRASALIDLADRAVLLTGTPLENRLDEFRSLVGYLRPDLVVDADELAPGRFRRQVAPAYLRRNQEDVLTELPDLVEVDEWLPLSSEDTAAYRQAVAEGNFMAMRQAAMSHGSQSEKMQRLREIVEEAEANGRRVIVFSHFRTVLDRIAQSLTGEVFGPLTGSVPAAARQIMVDQFSAAGNGAVLVAQIVAGGVGLNIQAASVVVICEPQLKPTTEWQAIARARRMGQLHSVQVHRLLSEEGVDQRITQILARKRELFNEFARVSATADSAPEAFDISEAELARDVVAAERERLFQQGRASSRAEAEV